MPKYNQKLPKEVEQRLDNYIERIKKIKWFQPSVDLKKKNVEKQLDIIFETFGIKASIEYRQLKTEKDWDAARDAARDAAWDAARGANDLLVQDLEDYKKKYPKGSFINLIPLWEMGLYPVGIINKKFVIYIPPSKQEFPKEFEN